MPVTAEQVQAALKDYEEATGGDDKTPEGNHDCVLLSGETHPAVKVNDLGQPSYFILAQITKGKFENQTIPRNLGWFVNPNDRDGEPKSDEKVKSGTEWVRRQTKAFLRGLFGEGFESAPSGFLFPDEGDSYEEISEVFSSWGETIVGMPIGINVKRNGEFENFSYKKIEGDGFAFD